MTKTEFNQTEQKVINRLKEHHNKWGKLLGASYTAIWKYEINHDPSISERDYQQALLDAYESIFMLGFLNSAFSTLVYESDPIERLYPGIGKNTQETFKTFVKEPLASQILDSARSLKFNK